MLALAIVGLVTYSANKSDAEAQQKAAQLTVAFQQAGLNVPASQDVFIRSLGNRRRRGVRQPGERARPRDPAGPDDQRRRLRRPPAGHRRPADPGRQGLIMQTYCPEKLQEFKDKTQDLKTDDVIKG